MDVLGLAFPYQVFADDALAAQIAGDGNGGPAFQVECGLVDGKRQFGPCELAILDIAGIEVGFFIQVTVYHSGVVEGRFHEVCFLEVILLEQDVVEAGCISQHVLDRVIDEMHFLANGVEEREVDILHLVMRPLDTQSRDPAELGIIHGGMMEMTLLHVGVREICMVQVTVIELNRMKAGI